MSKKKALGREEQGNDIKEWKFWNGQMGKHGYKKLKKEKKIGRSHKGNYKTRNECETGNGGWKKKEATKPKNDCLNELWGRNWREKKHWCEQLLKDCSCK